ncbi:5-oxoprolinase subunit PxpB [Peribacillus loiseleuriae]|uniref:5-oxoprolinase subunit PxpB n=1 Tax=Peribacillus loiseleuriae TaxID=1679170 RepID=UPI003D012596
MDYQLHPFGDNGIMIELGTAISPDIQKRVRAIASFLDQYPFVWMIEYIPAFTSVTVLYDIGHHELVKNGRFPHEQACEELREAIEGLSLEEGQLPRLIEIPVCYGGELGPDLEFVARHNGLSVEEVVRVHKMGIYNVHMIGFAPGFPYMGGMSEKIAAPRKESPRLTIPAGSVGIAGKQTGIYSIETPGGWQIIGRSPIQLFRPFNNPPSLLQAGDLVSFKEITYQEYIDWEDRDDKNH